jgi:transcriptional regulator with XRE-family HTH domain
MSAEPSPAVGRRQLGRQLRELRIAAGFPTIAAAAKESGLSTATISRIESAKQAIMPKTVRLLCQTYGIGAPMFDHLIRLAEDSEDRGWLVAYTDTVPNWFERYVGEETEATGIWGYESEFVPGLLQTADYCRAVSVASSPDVDEDNLQRLVSLRQARQERLSSKNPPQLDVVVNEAAIRRAVGSPDIMREQLHHLVELAKRRNITLRVLPFSAGAHPAMTNSFTMLHFPEGLGAPTIFVEIDSGALYPNRPADVNRYTWIMDRLRAASLSPAESTKLLSRVADRE